MTSRSVLLQHLRQSLTSAFSSCYYSACQSPTNSAPCQDSDDVIIDDSSRDESDESSRDESHSKIHTEVRTSVTSSDERLCPTCTFKLWRQQHSELHQLNSYRFIPSLTTSYPSPSHYSAPSYHSSSSPMQGLDTLQSIYRESHKHADVNKNNNNNDDNDNNDDNNDDNELFLTPADSAKINQELQEQEHPEEEQVDDDDDDEMASEYCSGVSSCDRPRGVDQSEHSYDVLWTLLIVLDLALFLSRAHLTYLHAAQLYEMGGASSRGHAHKEHAHHSHQPNNHVSSNCAAITVANGRGPEVGLMTSSRLGAKTGLNLEATPSQQTTLTSDSSS